MRINKRGLSPVITTVLLILIAVVLAIIILLWARGWIKQAITKDDRPIENVCREVSFEVGPVPHAQPLLDEIIVSNTGNIDIYSFSIEIETPGKTEVLERRAQDILTGIEITSGLGKGASGKFSVDFELTEAGKVERVTVKPVLEGMRGEVKERYVCANHPGVELEI